MNDRSQATCTNRVLNEVARLSVCDSGMFAISHLPTTLFLTISVICVFNVGGTLTDRTIEQSRADSAAESLGNWKARNMNAVVAQQHMIGEFLGLVITHHAIGGDKLDRREKANTQEADEELRNAQQGCQSCKTGTPAYPYVSKPVFAGKALLEAHLELKELLTKVYQAKTVALAMQAFPPTRPAGEALEQAAHLLEIAILMEWRTLRSVERAARSVTELKLEILHELLPRAKEQLDLIVSDYPGTQSSLIKELEDRFGVRIAVLDTDRRLPLKEDPWARLMTPPMSYQPPLDCDCPSVPADNPRHQVTKITQLSRATFPWVNYHREPLVRKMRRATPLSHLADHYFDFSNGVSKRMMDRLQRDGQMALYVLDDYEGPDKAHEAWMERDGSGAADKTFGLTVIVGTPKRIPVGDFFFRSQEGDFSFRIGTSFVWNRQPAVKPLHRIDLNCKRIVPPLQATTGWDTLNWAAAENVSELVGIGRPHTFPTIRPSWTSQLTPTSAARLDQIHRQNLPAWALPIRQIIPQQIDPSLIGI